MKIFLKENTNPNSTSLLNEVRGLAELRKFQDVHKLRVPLVEEFTQQFIKMEKIDSTSPTREDWVRLAQGLAVLHGVHQEQFGFEEDNYIGLNKQKNTPCDDWGEFYYECRLLFQVQLISNQSVKDELGAVLKSKKSELIKKLNEHNPSASLLHGDLWSGNVMFDESGPWLIDPAVYYGDRETDLAMTEIFGGFPPIFYETYFSLYKKPEGYDFRNGLYKLYHFLNHYNLFGDSYLSQVRSLLF